MIRRALAEARRDLAYRPRLPGRRRPLQAPWLWRRLIPFIVVLLVSVISADLLVLAELYGRDDRSTAAPREKRARGDFVASAGESGASEEPAPPVAPLAELHQPHLFVVSNRPLAPSLVARIRRASGVAAVEVTDAAAATMDGKRVPTMGVDPSTFRAYTPATTAGSDALWAGVARGEVAVSFELGNDGGLTLGSEVTSGGHKLRIGAYATVGMGSIAAVVSRPTARKLGLPEGNALVVSAPKVDSGKLRRALLRVLPKGSQVATINPVLVTPRRQTVWPASAFLSAEQTEAMLRAAVGKLGRPYEWGAEGPDTFDCSGLVQWAFRQAGVRMPRVAAQQWAAGPQIPLAQAQPGDLLFWRNDPTNPAYISHVAIYWGGDQMLHAPRTGDVVKLAKIYTKNLAGVVRVSPGVAAQVR
ncbi:hypothetical protein Aph01nite_37500 [Acrocarpospora phusangensis]|uniref:NlpC/P60 domain-containing protein n=1 Tax=Acrocarpospora phusangensis TaxID=1070424 RepID=A0A919QDL1_9ACTN|nr:C40 family peptidase [Acrocarpospora phusangensis]GIH25440.1 hypothetical protein Aph01nite_37500 [Acrocarpospora phusangensis]